MDRARFAGTVVVALIGMAGLGACDPPPPATPFVVTSTAASPDHSPGDGVCEATPGAGDCTLPAAVTEANAVPRAVITVPAGTYTGIDVVLEGTIEVNGAGATATLLADASLTVAAGANVGVSDVGSAPAVEGSDDLDVSIVVDGVLRIGRSQITQVRASDLDGIALDVGPDGGVLVTDSTLLGGTHAVRNAGSVVLQGSTVLDIFGGRIHTLPGGESHLRATLVSRAVNTSLPTSSCTGEAATSHGHSYFAPFAWGCDTADTDLTGVPLPSVTLPGPDGSTYALTATPGVVDAIPLGESGCRTGTFDVLGQPRGVDGNGDGVPGCDIGALEAQP